MVTYDEALALMLAAARPLAEEAVPLDRACGRILSRDVFADADMPPFDKAAMDGYACRRADLANGAEFTVIEEVPAGAWPQTTVGRGTCTRILTGAPVPAGADCVIRQEQVQRQGDKIRITSVQTPDNICRRGEDARSGDCLLRSGERLTPAHMAVLAAVGAVEPRVFQRPRVTVLATGSELVEPSTRPMAAQIRDSNSRQLAAQVQAMGALAVNGGIVTDQAAILRSAIREAMRSSDLLLLSGGVSTGDYDLVPGILKELGFEMLFDSVAMQPGRPTHFGRKESLYCCGLPGNPVSTYVIFEILVKPFLYRMMGHDWRPLVVEARLSEAIRRRNVRRQASVPVRFVNPAEVTPLEYHGSAHIHAMTRADGIVAVPIGRDGFEKGAVVHVRSFSA